MRSLPFFKYSPCGNVTILIKDVPLMSALRARAATEIIAPGHLAAEQAGFVDTNRRRLDMMGGEFCLNATRAMAVLLFSEGLLVPEAGEEWQTGIVEVSGMTSPVRVRARRCGVHYEAEVCLDLPEQPPVLEVDPGVFVVHLPGITHVVLDEARVPVPLDVETGKQEALRLLVEYSLLNEGAAGCIWLRQQGDAVSITPFVRVLATDTVYAETACGSGTLAASIVRRQMQNAVLGTFDKILQPSGESLVVTPEVSTHVQGWSCRVRGMVRLLARGEVFVDCLDEV